MALIAVSLSAGRQAHDDTRALLSRTAGTYPAAWNDDWSPAIARTALRDGIDALPVAFLDEQGHKIRVLNDYPDQLVSERVRLASRLRWHLVQIASELESQVRPQGLIGPQIRAKIVTAAIIYRTHRRRQVVPDRRVLRPPRRHRPIPAGSGNTKRHWLHRGGDRQVNRAIHIIAPSRAHRPRHPRLPRPPTQRRQAPARTNYDGWPL